MYMLEVYVKGKVKCKFYRDEVYVTAICKELEDFGISCKLYEVENFYMNPITGEEGLIIQLDNYDYYIYSSKCEQGTHDRELSLEEFKQFELKTTNYCLMRAYS